MQQLVYFQRIHTRTICVSNLQACRAKGVDCIVAPYEADAQLAYLMKTGITQCTISEDSDLLVYGCEKVQSVDNLRYRLTFDLVNKNEVPGKNLLKVVKFQNLVEKCCNVWKI